MTWPEELGGRGLTHVDAALAEEVLGYHWLPLSLYLLSYKTIGCALERFASPALKERLLGPIARGELTFCQGFSEPGRRQRPRVADDAGRAAGRPFVVDGHKIWTSSAWLADWIYLAVRTNPDEPRHRGISVLVAPLDTPGIEVRRFPVLGGGYLCEVFLDGVEIPAENLVGDVDRGWDVLMHTLDFERITAEKLGGLAWVLDGLEAGSRRRIGSTRPGRASRAPWRACGRATALAPRRRPPRPRGARERGVRDGKARRRAARAAARTRGIELLGLEGLADAMPPRRSRAARRSLPRGRRLDDLRRLGGDPAGRDRAARVGSEMTLPLAGVRVVEYAQYVAGPLCGVLLADLGADVVKVEPPAGDGYRHVMPVAPGIGRYFVPLNRGKRSVVLDLKTADGLATSARLLDGRTSSLHNFPRERARRFGLDWEDVHAASPALVVGRVSSFGVRAAGGRAGVRPRRAGARRACSRRMPPGDARARCAPAASRWPTSPPGFLLATGVLAALVRARETGRGRARRRLAPRGRDGGAAPGSRLARRVRRVGRAARGPRAARRTRRRDRRRRRDEPVLPLLRDVRRLRRGGVPQPRAAAGVPRAVRSRRRDDRRAGCRPRRPRRARGQGGADRT